MVLQCGTVVLWLLVVLWCGTIVLWHLVVLWHRTKVAKLALGMVQLCREVILEDNLPEKGFQASKYTPKWQIEIFANLIIIKFMRKLAECQQGSLGETAKTYPQEDP